MPLKMSYGTEVKPPPHSIEISWVGNLIMVKQSFKYVASKSILCFILINTKNTSYAKKKVGLINLLAVLHPDAFWYHLNGMGTPKKCTEKVPVTVIYFT